MCSDVSRRGLRSPVASRIAGDCRRGRALFSEMAKHKEAHDVPLCGGHDVGLAPRYFFVVVFFLPKLVSIVLPMYWSIPLAPSANCPVGASSRYLLSASAVPGAGVTLPVLGSVVALLIKFTPF